MNHNHQITVPSLIIGNIISLSLLIFLAIGCKKIDDPNAYFAKSLQGNTLYYMANQIRDSLNDKELILTFDDGPIIGSGQCHGVPQVASTHYSTPDKPTSEFNTGDLIDFLNYHKTPATFFVVVSQFYDNQTSSCLVRRMIKSKNLLVANHTWNHTSINFFPQNCDNSDTIKRRNPVIRLSTAHLKNISDQSQNRAVIPFADEYPEEHQQQGAGIYPTTLAKSPYLVIPRDRTRQEISTPSFDSPYPGYTNFITNEVASAACYLNQLILQDTESKKAAQDYPLFYRPPGGFWENEDKVDLLHHPDLESYIGPIGWHFGSHWDKDFIADHACWPTALKWASSNKEEQKRIEDKSHPAFIAGLKAGNPEKGCADAYVARIDGEPEGQKKGIILLHDNHPESISMFIKYLYPQLEEKGYKFIGLDQSPFIQKKLSDIREKSEREKLYSACVPAYDQWCSKLK
ncbi:MAG: polysaccharide deacetylase family protein [Proteobacteria bacterium]|nr:polysaccharide deacetylase family protein [Pseudomonadota bacterium]